MVGQSDLVEQERLLVVVRVGRVGYNMVMVLFFIEAEDIRIEKKKSLAVGPRIYPIR